MSDVRTPPPLLAVEKLRVSYRYAGRVQDAVKGISFAVEGGQFVSLVGESGSGKSTVAAALIGLLPGTGHISGGHIYLEGVDITGAGKKHLREIRGSKIGYIPQDALSGLDPLMRIGLQVQEAALAHTRMEKRAARKKTLESLFDAGLTDPETVFSSFPHELSGGMKQRSLIAAGMINTPQLLIADEPTSSLDVLVQQKILVSIKRLINESNCALLFITHNIALAAEHSDYLIVMKDGVIVEQGRARTIWEHPNAPYTRELIAAIPKISPGAGPGKSPACLIELDKITKYYHKSAIPALENVTLPIYEGTITAIIGGSGSGKTTLASVILQLEQQSSGTVYYLGNDICRFSKEELKYYRRAVQMIFQNPYESLNPLFTIRDIIGEPLRSFGSIDKDDRLKRIHEALDAVMLPKTMLDRRAADLSGGQRQRVAIARALITKPKMLICDEAVSALDVLTQFQILALIKDLRQTMGYTVLFITHDLGVASSIADTIAVMHQGHIVETGTAHGVFSKPGHGYTKRLLEAASYPSLEKISQERV